MIDEIYKLHSAYISTHGASDKDISLFVFNGLLDYIRVGKYTERRNKKIILNYWMTHSNKELAELLNVTVSSISYAKKDICSDLKKALGGTLVSLIRNGQFEKISQLIIIENDYSNYETIIPSCLIKEIDALYDSEKASHEDWKQKSFRVEKELVNALSGKTDIKSKETHYLLQFLQRNFFPKTTIIVEYFDIYQLKLITDILQGKHGTAEIRHNLITYLNLTPSDWENEVIEYFELKFFENM